MGKPKTRKTGRSGGFSFWRLLKITAVLASIPAIIVAAVLIYYYYVFDRMIEAKLGKRYESVETEIYSAPKTMFPGKAIALQDFLTQLRRLGYVERDALRRREARHVPGGQQERPDHRPE